MRVPVGSRGITITRSHRAAARRSPVAAYFISATCLIATLALLACSDEHGGTGTGSVAGGTDAGLAAYTPASPLNATEASPASDAVGGQPQAMGAPAGPPPVSVTAAPTEPWPSDILQAPDFQVRRDALEAWARQPTKSLDLVSALMLDPDESIRARAKQLFDEAMSKQ